MLRKLADHRPSVSFYDVLRTGGGRVPVLVRGGKVTPVHSDLPLHIGEVITVNAPYDHFDFLVDHGDLVLPGWGAASGAYDSPDTDFELVVNGDARVIVDLAEFDTELKEELAEFETLEGEDDYVEFLRMLHDATHIARTERLPVVAAW